MKTEYAYIVTDVTGCFIGQMEKGDKIIDNEYKGLDYTWKCVDTKSGDIIGTISGKYDGKAFTMERD